MSRAWLKVPTASKSRTAGLLLLNNVDVLPADSGSREHARQTAMREKRIMHTNQFKAILKIAARVLAILSFATAAYGQQAINLTAAPTTTTMPDGTVVPMWGYFCDTAATGSTATCARL
jgi:hypothetical protein